MSPTTLFVLVMVAPGVPGGLTFTPGFVSVQECVAQYKGPNVACFNYDPGGVTWSAFFRLADGSLRRVFGINSEAECQRYIGAFKDEVPKACRQLALAISAPCSASCPVPPAPPPAPPLLAPTLPPPGAGVLTPDPAGITDNNAMKKDDVQLADGHYHGSRPLWLWIPDEDNNSTVKVADKPFIEPAVVEPPPYDNKKRIAQRNIHTAVRQPLVRTQPPEPFKALIDVVMLPFDFLSYPARRDW
jgi:hypothetical protein